MASEALTPIKKRSGVRTLHNAHDVRVLIGKLIKMRLLDDLDNETLRAVTGACGILLKAISEADLDSRIADLEEKLDRLEIDNG